MIDFEFPAWVCFVFEFVLPAVLMIAVAFVLYKLFAASKKVW